MPSFKDVHAYRDFATAVKGTRRFIQTKAIAGFLRCVSAGSKDRELKLPAGKGLWRAQLGSRDWPRTDGEGHRWVEDAPYGPDRMKPLIRNPSEGRVNPRGIAYLYLAADKETAIAEVRPWSGALVSVGAFETKRDLKLVDCARHHGKIGSWGYLLDIPLEEWNSLSQTQIDEAVWADIDNAFSLPVGPGDEFVHYIPTQIIAEQFVADGFDGIVYKSALSEKGYNVALFRLADADLQRNHLFTVTSVKYEFEETTNPWFVKGDDFVTNVITDFRPVSKGGGEEHNDT
ncbi:RES family NAD+ phosphorylase [Sinorhizobium fredii]|uniref:RES family NAD+ phosphorylase n=1 Tax=Rhizobium fredii TaxID=380 RepID=UPI001296691E|nr:RES family NAD+ phosphorylase [Sinorhizobium fredii]MQW99615.1 RES domain-containing protein [Sinorhizobium fredii]